MFLTFNFWSWIFENTSKFWAASCKNDSNLLLVRITICIESCLAIGWRTFIWWKNPPKCSSILVRVAEWWSFYLRAAIQRTIDASPAFMEYGLAKKIAAWAHTNREPNKQEIGFNFAWSGSELWSCFKYSVLKLKNQKHIAVDVLLKGFPMVPLSCRSNLAGRYL